MARDHVSMGVKSLLLTLFSATGDISTSGGAAPEEPSPWNILSYIVFKLGQLIHAFEGLLTNLAADLVYPFKAIWNFIVLKLEEIFHAFEGFFTNLAVDLVYPFKVIWNFIVLKLEEIFHAFEGFFTNLAAKLEAFPVKEIWSCTVLKLKELILAFECFFTNLAAKMDKIFPPDKRVEWAVVAAPLVLVGTFVVILTFCSCVREAICGLLSALINCVRAIYNAMATAIGWLISMLREAICGLQSALIKCVNAISTAIRWLIPPVAVKLMKAPGRGGAMIVRAGFEANPAGYFRGLRAGTPLSS